MTIYFLKPKLRPGYLGSIRWLRGEREVGSIGYRVLGANELPTAVKLFYTINKRWSGDTIDVEYTVRLTSTPLPWGGVRYWFSCPILVNGLACNRRVGCLYLPPSENYFGCRHCYKLTYQSCQERGAYDHLFAGIAESMQDDYPGITGKDVGAMLEGRQTENLERITLQRFIREWGSLPDPYGDYLTADELGEQSGLSPDDIDDLKEIRLLVPDHDGKYRPKLLGWARKLAYLLDDGWELDEIKRWARGRFQTGNPKLWPPDREMWRLPLE